MLCKPQDSHNPWIKLWGRVSIKLWHQTMASNYGIKLWHQNMLQCIQP